MRVEELSDHEYFKLLSLQKFRHASSPRRANSAVVH